MNNLDRKILSICLLMIFIISTITIPSLPITSAAGCGGDCACGDDDTPCDCPPGNVGRACNCNDPRADCGCIAQCKKQPKYSKWCQYPHGGGTVKCNCGGSSCTCSKNRQKYCTVGGMPCGGKEDKPCTCSGDGCPCPTRKNVCKSAEPKNPCGKKSIACISVCDCGGPNCPCPGGCSIGEVECQRYDHRITSDENCVYVDGSNTNGPWDGSEEHPFQNIQDGINSATPCQTIFVLDGIYYENPIIDVGFSVKLDSQGAIIDGGETGSVVTIISDNVEVSGFTIRNCGSNELDAGIDIHSDHNKILANTLNNNQATGINLQDSANYNTIMENNIYHNQGAGIFIWDSSNDNNIYYNDLMDHGWFNAKDLCEDNNWDNNYWDDYSGSGEYIIPGGFSKDTNPLTEQWINHPPETPIINGSTSGTIGSEDEYTIFVTDPDRHDFFMYIDWGDENIIEYTGPILESISNQEGIHLTYSWSEEGTYKIRIKVKDEYYGDESEWATLDVSISKSKQFNTPSLQQFIERLINRFPFIEKILNQII
jgi:parallel beta-helix repeat protein